MGVARTRGAAGETLAASFLELQGLEVLRRNVRLAGVEVDLVAREGETQVLVEVKFRRRSDYGGAALAIDARKRERLLRAASVLTGTHAGPVRIDVVTVELAVAGAIVRHYRNAVTE